MNFLLEQLKVFFTNRIGLALVSINLLLLVWGMYEKGGHYNYFHWYYEPTPLKLFAYLNWWIVMLVGELERNFFPATESDSSFIMSDFYMLHVLIICILTWLVIGYIFNLCFQNIRRK